MVLVNGTSGLYAGTGSYGANAAKALQESARIHPDYQAGYRYTPAGHMELNDAFGYARENMLPYDSNQDGAVSQEELTAVLGNNPQISSLVAALDLDGDGKISIWENAASVIVADQSENNEQPDGIVTYQGMRNFMNQVQANPEAIRSQLADCARSLDLQTKYQTFAAHPYSITA